MGSEIAPEMQGLTAPQTALEEYEKHTGKPAN